MNMERVDFYLEGLDRQEKMNEFPNAPYRAKLCSSRYNIFFNNLLILSLPLSLLQEYVDAIVFNLNAAYSIVPSGYFPWAG